MQKQIPTENSLSQFTNQSSLSKTLRNGLVPIGKTASWIKKHDIIGSETKDGETTLVGVDARKASAYFACKKLFNKLHSLFIQDLLSIDASSTNAIELQEALQSLSESDELEISKDLEKTFKELMDKQAEEWIARYLVEMPKHWQKDIDELQSIIEKESNNQKKKTLQNAINKIQKKIDKPTVKKSGISALTSNTEALQLLEWQVCEGKIDATGKELKLNSSEEGLGAKVLTRIIRQFDGFSSYFTGFNENRANVYDPKGDKTSIIHRCFLENFPFHLNNIKAWETIQKKLADAPQDVQDQWQSSLKNCQEELNFSTDTFFTIEAFINFLSQKGIDRYNDILGGGSSQTDGKEKRLGLKQIINLTNQQLDKKTKLPKLQQLYKQILSPSDHSFVESFENDQEIFDKVTEFHNRLFIEKNDKGLNYFEAFFQEFSDSCQSHEDNKNNIYISKDKLSHLSLTLTGSWHSLNDLLIKLYDKPEKVGKQSQFSISEIEDALAQELDGESAAGKINEAYRSNGKNTLYSFFSTRFQELYQAAQNSWSMLVENGILGETKIDERRDDEGEKGFDQIAAIKSFLDATNHIAGFAKDLTLPGKKRPKDFCADWQNQLENFRHGLAIIDLYNKCRNHVTKKPYSTDKLKINFNNATLLDGWDRNKEPDNYGVLMTKDSKYYLAIMTPSSNKVFDYDSSAKGSPKVKAKRDELAKAIIADSHEATYQKVNYKLLPGANKMLPKVFFANSNKELFKPSAEIIKIKEEKLYSKAEIEKHGIENLHKYVDFCKASLAKHPEWSQCFDFDFSATESYQSVDQFYREVEANGYKLSFDSIKESYIDEKIENGELYLFQIYNQDFAKGKRTDSKDNLHTMYWKAVFEEENLKDTVIKLNGQAEIFFRPASLDKKKVAVHKVGEVLKHKSFGQTWKHKLNSPVQKVITLDELKKTDLYKDGKVSIKRNEETQYDDIHFEGEVIGKVCRHEIVKNRRFTEDKFFFHCPITMNFQAPAIAGNFNKKVNDFLRHNSDVNVIGIDRGEKHLLYLSVIDQNGKIKHQESLNAIDGYKGTEIKYHEKLDEVEKNRDKARKSWSLIENIKELKAGYLSQVVHKLAELIIKHNAIVVLEDLNMGFKRGRFKVEKQVYQKFEKALIDKLNYLVFKDKQSRLEAGHYLNAYQLAAPFESFQKLGKQTGILFYTTASYTSTTDPVTGFLKNVYHSYSNVEDAVKFWQSFDSIVYNEEKNRFDFTYTVGKIKNKNANKEKDEDKVEQKTWTVSSSVTRSRYVKAQVPQTEEQKQDTSSEEIGKRGGHECFFVTHELKDLLDQNSIDYQTVTNLKAELIKHTAKSHSSLHKSMIYYFNAILTMRVTDDKADKGSDQNDFILSPVEPFYDSRKAPQSLPENGDANGAYNIARKGLCILDKINQSKAEDKKVDLLIRKSDWQNYCQSKAVVKAQTAKMNEITVEAKLLDPKEVKK